MNPSLRNRLVSVVCIVVIALAGYRIWQTQSIRTDINVPLQEAIGEHLADLVISQLGGRGKVAVAVLDEGQSEEMDIQFASFKRVLGLHPELTIDNVDHVDSEGRSKYGPGRGMSARRLQRMVQKYEGVQLLVSFIGVPDAKDLEKEPLPTGHPRLIAVSRSAKEVYELAKAGVVQSVIVPRYSFPAPGPEHPRTKSEWFDRHFQVVQVGDSQ